MTDSNHYWKNIFDQKALKYKDDPMKQVGKTVFGKTVSPNQIDIISRQIITNLKLTKTSVVADLGCGNGILTKKIAKSVCEIRGFDFSTELIKVALGNPSPDNAVFFEQEIANVGCEELNGCTEVVLYEVIQHIPESDIQQLMGTIKVLPGIKTVFIGGIPNISCIDSFYNSPEKKDFYEKTLAENTPHLGNWWHKDDLFSIARQHDFQIEIIDQNPQLYTSHYRFDCIFKRASIA